MTPLSPKDLYTEAGQQARYYLSWREKLLGGYFAVMAALAFAFGKMWLTSFRSVAFLVPLLAAILSVLFWLLDRRNRTLYEACITAGAQLEKDSHLHGPYRAIDVAPSVFTHSRVLTFVFLVGFLSSVVTTIVALVRS